MDIYKMKMHEIEYIENPAMDIIRVPGGWIYIMYVDTPKRVGYITTVFVPYNKEFRGWIDEG